MNEKIEQLYTEIGMGIYKSLPKQEWTSATFTAKIIARYMEASGNYSSAENAKSSIDLEGIEVFDAFENLRAEMASLDPGKGAWYTATFTLTPDGDFNFDFDYDHLPAFDVIPSPDKWLEEFKRYPRPELQIQLQDWIDQKEREPKVIVQRLRELQAQ